MSNDSHNVAPQLVNARLWIALDPPTASVLGQIVEQVWAQLGAALASPELPIGEGREKTRNVHAALGAVLVAIKAAAVTQEVAIVQPLAIARERAQAVQLAVDAVDTAIKQSGPFAAWAHAAAVRDVLQHLSDDLNDAIAEVASYDPRPKTRAGAVQP